MGQSQGASRTGSARARRGGVAAIDYVLVLGVVLPLAAFVFWAGPRIMRLVYEMAIMLITWPFMSAT